MTQVATQPIPAPPAVFGQFLQEQRLQRRLTLRGMSSIIGLSHVHISRLEKGATQKITPRVIHLVSKKLDIPEELLTAVTGQISKAITKHNRTQDTVVSLLTQIRDELRRNNELLSQRLEDETKTNKKAAE